MISPRLRSGSATGLGLIPLVAWACLALVATLYLLAGARGLPLALAVPLSVAVPLPLLGVMAFERLRAKRLALKDAALSVLLFLVVGYVIFNRTFGYLGIPQLNLFVGEVALAAGLLLLPASLPATIGKFAARHPLLTAALVVWFAFGLVQVLRGVSAGYGVIEAFRHSAFHYYLLYLPLGLLAGSARGAPERVYGALRAIIWLCAIYGLLSLGLLYRFTYLVLPGTNALLFPQIAWNGSSPTVIAILALVYLRQRLGFSPPAYWTLLAANVAVLLGIQVRQDYVILGVAAAVWAILSKRDRLRPAGRIALTVTALVGTAWVADFQVPSARGTIGARYVIARVLASISPSAADRVAGADAERTADIASANVSWRVRWWVAIREHVSSSPGLLLLGEGYGYALRQLVDYVEEDVWTSHSVLYDTLGRLGLAGVALFALTFALILAAVLRVARADPEHAPFRLMILAYGAGFYVGAHFYNSFGAPFGAIPLWIMLGLALSPLGAAPALGSAPARRAEA